MYYLNELMNGVTISEYNRINYIKENPACVKIKNHAMEVWLGRGTRILENSFFGEPALFIGLPELRKLGNRTHIEAYLGALHGTTNAIIALLARIDIISSVHLPRTKALPPQT